MNTLAEVALLSTDVLKKGIALQIIYDCPLLDRLPFIDISGNSYQYNLELEAAGADYYGVGDLWKESGPTWNQRSVGLTILGGDVDVDNFSMRTRSNVQDVEAEILQLKAKAIAQHFSESLIMGGTTTTPKANEFKGLLQLIAECEGATKTDLDGINNTSVLPAHETSATFSLDMFDELIDTMKGGRPDFLMCSKRTRRKLTSLCRVSGAILSYTTVDARLGIQVPAYNGIPILVNDWIYDNYPDGTAHVLDIAAYVRTTTRASANDNSPVFAFRVGPDGFCGLQNGGLEVLPIGQLETKDARRTRLRWYLGTAIFNKLAVAVLINGTESAT